MGLPVGISIFTISSSDIFSMYLSIALILFPWAEITMFLLDSIIGNNMSLINGLSLVTVSFKDSFLSWTNNGNEIWHL